MKRLILILLIALLCNTALARETGLVYHEVQFVDETGAVVPDITSINIYLPDTTTNATIYMDPAMQNAITQSITTSSTNTTFTQSTGTVYWWGPDGYDYTFTNGTNIATNAGHRTRSSSEGRLYFPSYLTNISSADYEDGESVSYGSDDDFIVNAGTTGDLLTFTPVTNGTSIMSLGTTAATCDVKMWGDTAGYDLMWDATDNRLEFADNATLGIGADPDWYITCDGSTTTATGALTHASAQTFSADCTFTGNAYNVEWDNSSDTLHLLDNAELGIGGATTADGDVVFKHDGTTLSMTTIRTDEPWTIGGVTYGFDITYYFETAGVIFFDFDGDSVRFDDEISLYFGDGSDWYLRSSTAKTLDMIPGTTADSTAVLNVGADGAGADLILFGETASHTVWWDASSDFWVFGVDGDGVDVKFFGDTASSIMLWDTTADALVLTASHITLDADSSLTTPVEVVAATNAIEITESGKVFVLNHATEFVTTLPTVASSAGVTFRFIIGAAPADADYTIVTDTLENKIFGMVLEAETDTNDDGPVGADEDTITFVRAVAVVGDWVELTSDGVNWYVSGMTAADGGVTLTAAD